ncbi:hypothetical protein FTUN_0468 [Frigoriglobus tundricola]|uniref:Uncharacterized protein n=1 Tax=Frigoriglobus tundricola TaxID=2774151 RepID=A0A6M5YI36_9BACT|nr:hypothetical protein FTUN_0468 [Frigoriglobus tundricola]
MLRECSGTCPAIRFRVHETVTCERLRFSYVALARLLFVSVLRGAKTAKWWEFVADRVAFVDT